MTVSVEQAALRDVVRSMVSSEATEETVRFHMDRGGFDRDLWATLGSNGITGMAIPESYGGGGGRWSDVAIVAEQLGASLACVPYLPSAMATAALLAGSEAARDRWLPGIASGAILAVVAPPAVAGDWHSAATAIEASRRAGSSWILKGRASYVLSGAHADVVLITARHAGGLSVFATKPGVVDVVRTSDRSRPIAHVTLRDAPATLVGDASIVRRAHQVGVALLAAEQVGGAQACLDMSVDHAQTRHQFGRPIGSFQAVQHHCANMLVHVEGSRSAARRAVADLDSGSPTTTNAIAGYICGEAYSHCASMNVQIHGGIGYTWEHPAHLHVKRSRSSAVLLGRAAQHRQTLKDSGEVLVNR